MGDGFAGGGKHIFTDVPTGEWYTDAVNWAANNGIASGVGDNKSNPNADITREQMAIILNNYAKEMGIELPEIRELLYIRRCRKNQQLGG